MKSKTTFLLLFLSVKLCLSQTNLIYGDLRYMEHDTTNWHPYDRFALIIKKNLPDGIYNVYRGKEIPFKKKKNEKYLIKYYNNTQNQDYLYHVYSLKNGKFNGEQITYQQKNDVKRIVLYYKNDSLYKEVWWNSKDIKYSETNYLNGILNGLQETFYGTGILQEKKEYVLGILKNWEAYYPSGKVKKKGLGEICYREGTLTEYFENGSISASYKFNQGLLQNWEQYYENGQKKVEGYGGIYEGDIKIYFFPLEKPCQNFKPSLNQGTWNYYNEEGKIIKTEVWKDGKLQ